MDVWHVVLEEGFRDDDVKVRIDGHERYDGEQVSTNPLLGYAVSFETEMSVGSSVAVEVPTRSVSSDFVLPESPARQLVVSIIEDALQFLTPRHARGYA